MSDAFLWSHVMLWVLVVALSGVVFVLARQVGILHERIQPVGALALTSGPEVGAPAPEVAAMTLTGAAVAVGAADPHGRSRLLFFVSPTCPVCQELLPTVRRVAEREGASLLFASDGAESDHSAYAADHGIDPGDYVVSETLGLRYGVAKLPYAVLLDGDGRVRAQGIVNQREHVESLFEAQALGVGTLQEYLSTRDPHPPIDRVRA